MFFPMFVSPAARFDNASAALVRDRGAMTKEDVLISESFEVNMTVSGGGIGIAINTISRGAAGSEEGVFYMNKHSSSPLRHLQPRAQPYHVSTSALQAYASGSKERRECVYYVGYLQIGMVLITLIPGSQRVRRLRPEAAISPRL